MCWGRSGPQPVGPPGPEPPAGAGLQVHLGAPLSLRRAGSRVCAPCPRRGAGAQGSPLTAAVGVDPGGREGGGETVPPPTATPSSFRLRTRGAIFSPRVASLRYHAEPGGWAPEDPTGLLVRREAAIGAEISGFCCDGAEPWDGHPGSARGLTALFVGLTWMVLSACVFAFYSIRMLNQGTLSPTPGFRPLFPSPLFRARGFLGSMNSNHGPAVTRGTGVTLSGPSRSPAARPGASTDCRGGCRVPALAVRVSAKGRRPPHTWSILEATPRQTAHRGARRPPRGKGGLAGGAPLHSVPCCFPGGPM